MRRIMLLAVCGMLVALPAFAQSDKELAEKWMKQAQDTLKLAEATVDELVKGGIEKIAKENEAVATEWKSAGEWLSLAKEKLEEAKKQCDRKKWKKCADLANESWQYLVKAATAAINAGRAAGLK